MRVDKGEWTATMVKNRWEKGGIMTQQQPAYAQLIAEIAETRRTYASLANMVARPAGESTCVLVTSAARGEGKTLTAAGLALVAAQTDRKRTLVVDLNWFAPALHSAFGLDQKQSLGDLSGKGKLAALVQKSGFDRLDVLAAPMREGSHEPVGIEESAVAAELLRKARDSYDLILVDMPPVFPTNRRMIDPAGFGRLSDGVVLVVLANVTPRRDIVRAKGVLTSAGASIAGVVVNQWKNPLA